MTHNIIRQQRSRTSGITCRQVADLIYDYIAGALNPRDALTLKAHLRECPDCIAFLATYNKTIQAAKSLRYETIPPAMRKRVRQFLQKKIGEASHATPDPA